MHLSGQMVDTDFAGSSVMPSSSEISSDAQSLSNGFMGHTSDVEVNGLLCDTVTQLQCTEGIGDSASSSLSLDISRSELRLESDAANSFRCRVCGFYLATSSQVKSHVKIHACEYVKRLKAVKTSQMDDEDSSRKSMGLVISGRNCSSSDRGHSHKKPPKVHSESQSIKLRKRRPQLTSEKLVKETNAGLNSDPAILGCRYCSEKFPYFSLLQKHLRANHYKIFSCTLCSGKFDRKSKLESHMRSVHRKLKAFKCDECGIMFSRKEHLKHHITSIHHKLQSFVCTVCFESFVSEIDLDMHVSVHKNQKQFKCSYCTREFARRKNLIDHLWKKHQVADPGN